MSPILSAPDGARNVSALDRNLWPGWADPAEALDGAAAEDALRRYLEVEDTWFARRFPGAGELRIAYFSAEFAVAEALRIYAGGLGVLAGDHLKSASDLGVPLVGVGLYYTEGYFTQRVDAGGAQLELYQPIDPATLPLTLERRADGEPLTVEFPFLGHRLRAQIWRADVGRIPLYLLDTNITANRAEDRRITDRLYGGDAEHRLRQEMVLGIGGMRALERLGISPTVLHLNEGHAAFAAVERVRQAVGDQPGLFRAVADRLREGVVFTTHTPVPAGHDEFDAALMERYMGGYVWEMREPWDRFMDLGRPDQGERTQPFNMTMLALRLSGGRNGVSRLHGEVSRRMWRGVWPEVPLAEVPIAHVTNGIHLSTWVAPPMARLFQQHIGPDWMNDADELNWHRAAHIPLDALWQARTAQRTRLVERVRARLALQAVRRGQDPSLAASALSPDALTIVFARRFATYKRATLLLSDTPRLLALLRSGLVQFVFAGKAHPRDEPGQELLRRIFAFSARPEARGRLVLLEDYDLELARDLVAGADVWLNVPRRPREASGTSGMKSAANGGLNASILDGWWAEAWTDHNHLTHPIGWAVATGEERETESEDLADALATYRVLEDEIVPLFYERHDGVPVEWCERIRASLRQVLPYFNTHRMVGEYVQDFYIPAHNRGPRPRVVVEEMVG